MPSTSIAKQAVDVAVSAPIDKTLSYAVPANMAAGLCVGSRVRVPLGHRQVIMCLRPYVGTQTHLDLERSLSRKESPIEGKSPDPGPAARHR